MDLDEQYRFFNKAITFNSIYQIGMNKGTKRRNPVLTAKEEREEEVWGKESRNIKNGILPVIKTEKTHLIVNAIRNFVTSSTLTLVELHGITLGKLGDGVIRAIADVLPNTTILALNLGEMEISADALNYLLEKVKDSNTILGALFIDEKTINSNLKRKFIDALGNNRKKITFLERISDVKRWEYLKTYSAMWWNLNTNPISVWNGRFERESEKLAKTGLEVQNGFFWSLIEDDDVEDDEEKKESDEPLNKKMKK